MLPKVFSKPSLSVKLPQELGQADKQKTVPNLKIFIYDNLVQRTLKFQQ